MPSWLGTVRVSTTKSISHLLPRNRSFAKANPASEQKNSTEAVTAVETMALLTRPAAK